MKYKIFLTDSIEVLKNEVEIGAADTIEELMAQAVDYFDEAGIHSEEYWRYLMGDIATFIDFGSWSKFLAVVPPVTMADLCGNETSSMEIETEDIE